MNINNFTKFFLLSFLFIFLSFLISCKENNSSDENDTQEEITGIYYVSQTGNDSSDGSKQNPWKTITHSINSIKPREKLIITEGIYKEKISLENIGESSKTIYIEGENKDKVIIDGSNVDRDLFFLDHCKNINISKITFRNAPRAGIRLSYSDNITIIDCIIKDNGLWGVFTDFSDYTTIDNCSISNSSEEHGIYISNSSDNATIKNNIVFNNSAAGIQINADPSMGGDGISSDCLIENNIIYKNGRDGGAAINLASVRDSTIQNNIIYKNYAGGIAAWDDGQGEEWGSKNLKIIHNTIYFSEDTGRWCISLKNGSTDAYIANNILSGGEHGGFEFNSNCLDNITIDYNIYYRINSNIMIEKEDIHSYSLTEWKNKGYDAHSFIESPSNLFLNISDNNFHLISGAKAIDKGLDSGLSYDFEGDKRPKNNGYDIGADEK